MAAPRTSTTTARTPEVMTSPSLAGWLAAWIETHVERDENEAREQGVSRLRAAEFRMARNAGAQLLAVHEGDGGAAS